MDEFDSLFPETETDFEFVTTNGAWRSGSGRFYELPERRFYEHRYPDRQQELAQILSKLALRAGSGSPLHSLQAIRAARRRLEDLELEVVVLARSSHWSWTDIAAVLGMSRSAVHNRFARADVPPRRRLDGG